MIKLIIGEMVAPMGGRARAELSTVTVNRISTDSRDIAAGDLFFALSGERFDGHEFVSAALRGGAVSAVVAAARAGELELRLSRELERPIPAGALIEVEDPLQALNRLAAYHRGLISADVIAVVGSNGKTTTKAMIDHILSGRMSGHCSPKSFNNEIGVPLSLLSAEAPDEYLVIEIGTSAPGEVAALARIAQPNMAVITCVAEEHLEGLKDLAGVAAEECAILGMLESRGFAAVNIDQPVVLKYLPSEGVSLVTYGCDEAADVRVTDIRYEAPWLHFTINGRFKYRLCVAGAHNALNAAGAITVALRLGFGHEEISERLASFVLPPMRGEVLELDGLTVLNDAYNANPSSAEAAFNMLDSLPCQGRRIVVFGEMCELGRQSAELHRQVAKCLLSIRVDRVYLVGPAGKLMSDVLVGEELFGPGVTCCDDVASCRQRLLKELGEGDLVLLKASRAVGLDQLVEPLRQRCETSSTT
ncbi:MAG: UDP-N-acetylmuramoyl-tripeptide--D-alanyl-D-alanine ligase [Planctomycetota bacterium]